MIIQNCKKTYQTNLCDFDNITTTTPALQPPTYKNNGNYFKNQNILNCDKNNSSRTCPVLLCNFEKQRKMNESILKRNFPDNNQKIVLDYRPHFNVCMSRYDYKNYNDNLKQNINKKVQVNINNVKSELVPGRAHVKRYFENIDVESELKNIFEKNKKCSRNFPKNKRLVRKRTYVGCINYTMYI